ncbi:MAG: tRNA 2-thiouridine(34) synthase MnmA [Bdellovibrio sp.]
MSMVVCGMSGGVDSSVSAYLLKHQGHQVVGLFMKNWDEQDEFGVCTSEKDWQDVERVSQKIGISYHSMEFIEEYRNEVFAHFLKEYKEGHTPNPDILCNREIKFKVFLDKAMELGADFLATGHYCRKKMIDGEWRLLKGLDPNKDQSYFLYTINKDILAKVLFPVGELPKSEVRRIAHELDLSTKDKKDSTGICFIGERNFRKFLGDYIKSQKGEFKTLNGEVVGTHEGACFYTMGQRKGLGLGGQGRPWFVVGKDMATNTVFVERGEEHPALYADELTANELSFVSLKNPEFPLRARAKIRYRQPDQDCTIESLGPDRIRVVFDRPQRAITPRQSVVFYTTMDGEEVCLGGAMIEQSGATYYDRNLTPELSSSTSDH